MSELSEENIQYLSDLQKEVEKIWWEEHMQLSSESKQRIQLYTGSCLNFVPAAISELRVLQSRIAQLESRVRMAEAGEHAALALASTARTHAKYIVDLLKPAADLATK